MLDLLTSWVLEFGVGDVLNLDFSWLGVDDAPIFAHHKPLVECGQKDCGPSQRGAKASRRIGT